MRLNLNHLLSYLNFMTAITLILFPTPANCKLAKKRRECVFTFDFLRQNIKETCY